MNVLVRNMKVECLNSTQPIDVVRAWVGSRSKFLSMTEDTVYDSNSGETFTISEYFDKIIKMDLGFSYFANITLRIQSSLLLREYFYTSQEYQGKWAETARLSTPDELILSDELYDGVRDIRCIDDYCHAVEEYNQGKNNQFDETREKMPLCTQRMYQMSLPVKVLMRLLGHLYLLTKGTTLWKKVWVAFSEVPQLQPWLFLIGKSACYDEELNYWRHDNLRTTEVGLVLYSQLIRHRGIRVYGYDNFLYDYVNNYYTGPRNCSAKVSIQVHDIYLNFRNILRTRTLWFAVTDGDWGTAYNTWAVFLRDRLTGDLVHDKEYLGYFDSEGNWDQSAVTEYSVDDEFRIHKGYNAYFPDAFALQSKAIVEERIARYGSNPLLEDYLQIFDMGYVKDNPDNAKRKLYESYST